MTSASPSKQFLLPPGRVVQGSLYKAQDKDMDGRPRVFPPGHPKAGQAKISYFFAVAIQKRQGETAWWDTAWGKEVVAIAQASWPQGQWQHPTFAWKIEDGDSQTPNKRGRKNCNTEGFPGHWIVNISSGYPPKIFLPVQGGAPQPLVEPDVVKLGYWVEVLVTVRSNETAGNPGVYINHDMVAFRGRDKEIFAGPDPSTVGFGAAAVPSHVTMAPVAAGPSSFPAQMPGAPAAGVPGMPAAPAMGMPGAPAMPGVPGMPAVPGAAAPMGATPAAPVAVQPHAGFIAPPVAGMPSPGMPAAAGAPSPYSPPAGPAAPSAPGMPGAPAAPAAGYADPAGAPAGYRMANPNGARYDAYRQNGWSDAQLLQNGVMVRL